MTEKKNGSWVKSNEPFSNQSVYQHKAIGILYEFRSGFKG